LIAKFQAFLYDVMLMIGAFLFSKIWVFIINQFW